MFNLWNFSEGTDLKFPGQIPVGVIENLLWYFTEPFDVVYDPFAGSGTTIRACKAMMRRWQASDIAPIDHIIQEHDITKGAPAWLTKPDFIFLDPPYWDMKQGDYSDDDTNLANMELEQFYSSMDGVARFCKDMLRDGGHIAWIISASQKGNIVFDHAIKFADIFSKYFAPIIRCDVPYSTQQAQGFHITQAREGKYMLKQTRDLYVFQKRGKAAAYNRRNTSLCLASTPVAWANCPKITGKERRNTTTKKA